MPDSRDHLRRLLGSSSKCQMSATNYKSTPQQNLRRTKHHDSLSQIPHVDFLDRLGFLVHRYSVESIEQGLFYSSHCHSQRKSSLIKRGATRFWISYVLTVPNAYQVGARMDRSCNFIDLLWRRKIIREKRRMRPIDLPQPISSPTAITYEIRPTLSRAIVSHHCMCIVLDISIFNTASLNDISRVRELVSHKRCSSNYYANYF